MAGYVVARPAKIAKMPESLSFGIAATLPVVGITAASLFDKVNIGPCTCVLINSATGDIGGGETVVKPALRSGRRAAGCGQSGGWLQSP